MSSRSAPKRARSNTPPPPHKRQKTAEAQQDPSSAAAAAALPADFFSATSAAPTQPEAGELDELDAEWARFEAEVVSAPAPSLHATISAAPVMAGDIAAAKEEEVAQEEKEGAGEAEDEQERLLDEFDEMVGLEERVRRLKERREALRGDAGGSRLEVRGDARKGKELEMGQSGEEEGSSDDEGDEEEDDFFFRR